MSRKFQRRIEDFVCENCQGPVKGDGYTNHCPQCLWSKHVDNNPGDRENICGGLMKPSGAFLKKGQWHVLHRCQKCGQEKTNKVSQEDNLEVLRKININQAKGDHQHGSSKRTI